VWIYAIILSIKTIKIFFIFVAAWDPKNLTSEQLFKVLYLVQVASFVEEETQVRGAVIIIDFHGLSTKQVMALSPSFAMTLLLYIQVNTLNNKYIKIYFKE